MQAANIDSVVHPTEYHNLYSPLATPASRMPPLTEAHRRRKSCWSWCGSFMWRLINCFRSSGQQEQPSRPRPIVTDSLDHQYQAPIVTPSPRASGSVSSCDEDHERGTLLPKRRTQDPLSGGASSAAGAAAATGAVTAAAAAEAAEPADTAAADVPRHRRTGSDGARLHVEGVRARVVTTAAAAAKAKFGTTEAEFTAVAELLGTDADDEDFCPTCLEVYTDDNPKIFTRCGHAFHMQCIYAWLERKNTCPLCESPMDLQDDILL